MSQEKIDPREALAGKLVGYAARTVAKPTRQVTSKVGGKAEGIGTSHDKIDPREALTGKLVGYAARTGTKPMRQVTSKVGGRGEGTPD